MEADARNPNLYTSLEDLKDNRVKVTAEENIYDEIRQRQRTLQREGIKKYPNYVLSEQNVKSLCHIA